MHLPLVKKGLRWGSSPVLQWEHELWTLHLAGNAGGGQSEEGLGSACCRLNCYFIAVLLSLAREIFLPCLPLSQWAWGLQMPVKALYVFSFGWGNICYILTCQLSTGFLFCRGGFKPPELALPCLPLNHVKECLFRQAWEKLYSNSFYSNIQFPYQHLTSRYMLQVLGGIWEVSVHLCFIL